ncbi:MAG: hypothetical protein HOV71_18720 [Hamadaea sp.]|nr:hypothetical protein [Hamadaea sp.]NUR50163.1 hypothetical protein [Hamadaea sp.]NUT03860.1 hypothetical protein [Hamadaea sp.]
MTAVEVTVSGRVGPLLREAVSGTPIAGFRLVTVLRVTAADADALCRLLRRLEQTEHSARAVRFRRPAPTGVRAQNLPGPGDDPHAADSRE